MWHHIHAVLRYKSDASIQRALLFLLLVLVGAYSRPACYKCQQSEYISDHEAKRLVLATNVICPAERLWLQFLLNRFAQTLSHDP